MRTFRVEPVDKSSIAEDVFEAYGMNSESLDNAVVSYVVELTRDIASTDSATSVSLYPLYVYAPEDHWAYWPWALGILSIVAWSTKHIRCLN